MTLRAKIVTMVAATAAALSLTAAGTASAADGPTTQELLAQCQRADVCEFHPSGSPSIHDGPRLLAGSATNCTSALAKRTISRSATEGTSNSFGIEISASTKLGQSFEASVTTSYHREWNWSSTTTDTIEQEVPSHSKINIFAAKQKSRINGNFELHFKKRYYGHYIWYSASGWIDGQTLGQPWDFKTQQVAPNC